MKKGFLHQFAMLVTLVCSAFMAQAQMVDCAVFLKGHHMEIGINGNGAFGTSVEPPSGYHANVTDTLFDNCTPYFSSEVFQDLGFVVDSKLTNWTAYYGDYIMPGNPREGWAIANSSGTATAYSYNYYTGTTGFTGTLTGANYSYTATGGTIKGFWNGAFDSTLNVNQITTIDTGNLYLMVHVGFYNTDTTTDSFYYLRFINPHNDEVTTSNFNTKGKIEHQLPNPDGLVVVSATSLTDTLAYIALGTRDPRAKCFIMKDSTLPGPGSLASIWAGDTVHYSYSTTISGNQGIGLVYKISLGPGDSSFLDYGYSFKSAIIDTVLDTSLHGTGGGGGTLKTQFIANGQNINIFPNPSTDLVYITGLSNNDNITICDFLGRQITPVIKEYAKGSETISIKDFAPGMYMLIVSDAFGKVVSGQPVRKN